MGSTTAGGVAAAGSGVSTGTISGVGRVGVVTTEPGETGAGVCAGAGVGAAAGVAAATTGTGERSGAATTTGAVDAGLLNTPATTGAPGRATTAPTGGRLAMAAGGSATMRAPWFGRGTMRRGAGVAGACGATAATGAGGAAGASGAATAAGGAATGAAAGGAATTGRAGATVTVPGRGATTVTGRTATACGGRAAAAAWAFFRSRIARRASPGFEMLDRSRPPRLVAAGALGVVPERSPRKYARTRSAWSSSMELECVLPETPMASSASRMGLLLTSSSRARSLILTLFIRPFSLAFRFRLAGHTSLVGNGNRLRSIISEICGIAVNTAKRALDAGA